MFAIRFYRWDKHDTRRGRHKAKFIKGALGQGSAKEESWGSRTGCRVGLLSGLRQGIGSHSHIRYGIWGLEGWGSPDVPVSCVGIGLWRLVECRDSTLVETWPGHTSLWRESQGLGKWGRGPGRWRPCSHFYCFSCIPGATDPTFASSVKCVGWGWRRKGRAPNVMGRNNFPLSHPVFWVPFLEASDITIASNFLEVQKSHCTPSGPVTFMQRLPLADLLVPGTLLSNF